MFVDGLLTFNLRGDVLSKFRKLYISNVKLSLFLDRRSKFNFGWCCVRFITNQVWMENDEHPINSKFFTILNGSANENLRGGVSLKWTELNNLSVLLSFLYTPVCNNRYKYVFLLAMTTFTEILFTFVRRWVINFEFTWWRFMKMDKIVHFKCQNCIIAGSKVKISLPLLLCTFFTNTVSMENDRTFFKFPVFYDPKRSS